MANVRQKLQGRWKSVAVEEKQLSGCSYRQRLSSKQHQPMHLAIRLHRLSLEIRAAVASAHLCPQPSPFPFPLPTAAKIIVIVVVVSAQVTEAIMLNTRRRVHDKYCIMLNYTRLASTRRTWSRLACHSSVIIVSSSPLFQWKD